jgi:hypothetical protein
MTISRKTKISIITLVTVALAALLTSNSEAAIKATSTSKPSISSSVNGGGANRAAAFKKYSDCLTSHGGTAPQFRGGPGSNGGAQPSTSAAQQAAMTACKALAPKFGGRGMGFNRQLTPTQQKAMTAYVACLKGKGLAVKTSADLRTLNRTDAKVQAALTSCQSKSPFQFGNKTTKG